MRPAGAVLPAAALLLLTGCTVPERPPSESLVVSATPGLPTTVEVAGEHLTLSLKVERVQFLPGQGLTVHAVARNPTPQSFSYLLGCDPAEAWSFAVQNATGGRVVQSWELPGAGSHAWGPYCQPVHRLALGPGERAEMDFYTDGLRRYGTQDGFSASPAYGLLRLLVRFSYLDEGTPKLVAANLSVAVDHRRPLITATSEKDRIHPGENATIRVLLTNPTDREFPFGGFGYRISDSTGRAVMDQPGDTDACPPSSTAPSPTAGLQLPLGPGESRERTFTWNGFQYAPRPVDGQPCRQEWTRSASAGNHTFLAWANVGGIQPQLVQEVNLSVEP